MATGVSAKRPVHLPERGGEFLQQLEAVSREIRDPAAKLRYLRASLASRPRIEERLNAVPGAPVRKALYRWASLEQARKSAGGRRVDSRMERSLFVARGMGVLAAASVLAALAGAASAAFQAGARLPASASVAPAPATASVLPPVAEPLPELPPGIAPKAIWLVEKGEDYEQYSNGLRVETGYSVPGPRRHYRAFSEAPSAKEQPPRDQPVGVMFHTTESDIWPLEAGFNENLRGSSQRLLRYLRREKVYHYLIDRFGRVFRVVEEDAKANHAGAGAWADGDLIYLSLNNAFLAVSFETRWEGGRALPITAAQLTSGRSLTDYLRHRYEIKPEMCVGHGLTSLNAKKRLIGHHLDWARGFPFAAFSLPDQYARPPANVAYFGFGYDDSLAERMGEPWPGVIAGEGEFAREAEKKGLTVEALRHQRRGLYDRWLSQLLRDEDLARADQKAASKTSGG